VAWCAEAQLRQLAVRKDHLKLKLPHQTQSNLIKGYFAQKIPNFFQGTFIGNHWQILKK